MTNRITILTIAVFLLGCGEQKDLRENQISDSYVETVADRVEPPTEIEPDHLVLDQASVVFYAPKSEELNTMIIDQASREGLVQAIGDFAYYASLVQDSLQLIQINSWYTDKQLITLKQDDQPVVIDRKELNAPIGMILFDGIDRYKVLPGMQTHLSLLSAIHDFFNDQVAPSVPLLDHFKLLESTKIHVYSSHSDILNQVGQPIDPSYYPEFGDAIASKASKFHMSVFAYQKFDLGDSLTAVICRVPSTYDESAVRLYIWDKANLRVMDQKLLAENVWNENWILVQDSWIVLGSEKGKFSFVSRRREASVEDGKRVETDSLSGWKWTGKGFQSISTTGLSLNDYPLQDWESYQEAKVPTEITIIDEDFVWLPLETGDLSWENIIMELPKPYNITKEPIENPLATLQMDTLITITRENLILKFYQAPNDILLIDGAVTDGSINLKKGIRVGISKMEFVKNFEKLSHSPAIPDLIKVRSKSSDRVISYSFQQDTLARIEFTNYIH
jgi:hypothetical protein